MSKYVLITGVNGQLGECLAKKFGSQRDWNVSMDIDANSGIAQLYSYYQGSVADKLTP